MGSKEIQRPKITNADPDSKTWDPLILPLITEMHHPTYDLLYIVTVDIIQKPRENRNSLPTPVLPVTIKSF